MKWQEIREQFPNRIVLVEALEATSEDKERVIKEMGVINEYNTPFQAWKSYKEYHKEHPDKEFYIFHTSKENIEVKEEYFTGIRGRS